MYRSGRRCSLVLCCALSSCLGVVAQTAATSLDTTRLQSTERGQQLRQGFVYDARTGYYLLTTYLGGIALSDPIPYTLSEYLAARDRWGAARYWDELNGPKQASLKQLKERTIDPFGLKLKQAPLDRLFGPGGLQLQLQASAELSLGMRSVFNDNPLLSERARRHQYFDNKQQIQTKLNARLGDKLDLRLDYSSQNSFSLDAKGLKLSYSGQEDDIIKLIELGQVQLQSRNKLIGMSGSMLGLHTQLQLGRLTADLLLSQQRSERHTLRSQGGAQQTQYSCSASDYDAGRHFFLSRYFRDHYTEALSQLPQVRSSIRITRLELWVTNRRANYESARSILALNALSDRSSLPPSNQEATRYQELSTLSSLRGAAGVSSTLTSRGLHASRDYELLDQARLLSPEEYTLQPELGYISLHTALAPDEVLAAAYEYTYQGRTYRVGEFASDHTRGQSTRLFLELLKGTDPSPEAPYWSLMMRNIYRIGRSGEKIDPGSFDLDILYYDDASSRRLPYLTEGAMKEQPLRRLLGVDRLDSRKEARPDGHFDLMEGYTIRSEAGLLIFPSLEPFGVNLKQALGTDTDADRYSYEALYRLSRVQAKELAAKDKFVLQMRYRSHQRGVYQLGHQGGDPSSIRVRAAGTELTEGVDYRIDAAAGTLQLLNTQLLESNSPIEIELQGNSGLDSQRKTVLGLELNYKLSRKLQVGASFMHLHEQASGQRLRIGQELLRQSMWGLHLNYQSEQPKLTDWLNRISWGKHQAPSQVQLSAELAQLTPHRINASSPERYSYLDDFDAARSGIDLMSPSSWHLASTPVTLDLASQRRGNRRARLAWFSIDPSLIQPRSSLSPSYIRNNPDLVSNHFVREISSTELYPHRDFGSRMSYIPTLSLSFYPSERGPYNLNTLALQADGTLASPELSWAGITRSLSQSDFEASGIDYLEFWLMNPFVYDKSSLGGTLHIDLGEISEDVLPDGRKSNEQGLGNEGATALTTDTELARIPNEASVGYSFASSSEQLRRQDVGLDGLSDDEERRFPSYRLFLEQLRSRLASSSLERWQADPHSPLNDPAGDNFHHYRGGDYDDKALPILDRYKYYNGTEGNSSNELAATPIPDNEDIDRDNTLNETNRYYEYDIALSPQELAVGKGYVVGERTVQAQLRNGQSSEVTWYQFRIPITSYSRQIGGIQDWRNIRFMRLFLRGFEQTTQLRFGALRLMRGDWRIWTESLTEDTAIIDTGGSLSIGSVNLEEHSDRQPINYVLPPTSDRTRDQDAAQSRQRNEQALAIKAHKLGTGAARAIYRNVQFDLRRYTRLQLQSHLEQLIEEDTDTQDGDLELFLRLGSDYTQNYYEYSLPLQLTPPGRYSSTSSSDRLRVWPEANLIDITLEHFVALKQQRNARQGSALGMQPYSEADPRRSGAQWSILGNPSLAHIRSLMIGIRNRSGQERSAELWLNDLRVDEYQAPSGWAGNAQLALQLSDLASISLSGRYSSPGFGAIGQRLGGEALESRATLSLATRADLGRLFPPKAKLRIPLYYSLNTEELRPEYDAWSSDQGLDEALERSSNNSVRQALLQRNLTKRTSHSLSLTGVKLDKRSKRAMPYDPANLSLGFSHSGSSEQSPNTAYRRQLDWQARMSYDYSPSLEAWRPFKGMQNSGAWSQFLRQYSISPLPNKISMQTRMLRHYDEEQLRNLSTPGSDEAMLPASWTQLFLWNRKLEVNWTPLSDLHLKLRMGTDARIEEPMLQVNRQLNPDAWQVWRDSVAHSISHGGTPLHYGQESSVSWLLPTARIRPLSFITGQLSYQSSYSWDRGTLVPDGSEQLNNSLSNEGRSEAQLRLQLKQLYMQIPYFRGLEQHYGGQSQSDKHYNWLDRLVYTLLMPRELSIHWRQSNRSFVPSYSPVVAAIGGQSVLGGQLRPGLGFALGRTTLDDLRAMAQEGLLISNPDYARPLVYSHTHSLDLRSSLQPLRDLNITLTAHHSATQRSELQYYLPDAPLLQGGDLRMTTIGLRGAFERPRANAGYRSASFERFLSYRAQIADRQRTLSSNSQAYLAPNDPLILIPAFRAAYTLGASPEGVSLNPLPKLLSMLPNWNLYYSGLSRLEWVRPYFRSITLRHSYRGIYSLGSYTSFADWTGIDASTIGTRPIQELGRTTQRLSYAYDFSSVSIQESFFPLLGLDLNWVSGLDLSTQWRRNRAFTLGLSSYRLIESFSDEVALELGYKLRDIEALLLPSRRRKRRGQLQSQGLQLRGSYSYRNSLSLIRSIDQDYSQATLGTEEHTLRISAEYELSRYISLKGYYEWIRSRSLSTSYAFPISTRSYGIALRLSLPELKL